MKKVIALAIAILLSGSTLFASSPAATNVQPDALFAYSPTTIHVPLNTLFASLILSNLGPADTSKSKKIKPASNQYTCLMHPEIVSNKPGKCPKCGMTLVKKKPAVKKETAVRSK